jgi:pimeloyl-[acyl-carrier protein] methyl ester esterase|tara:strand:+ start:426 stop:1190 length:765 start_codon:yes stop_codon:yes gene_type:complete
MNIKIIGEGEPLLLIHGWGMSGRIWEIIEVDLSKYYKLYIVDLPGMGKSDEIKDYTITNLVDQLYIKLPEKISIMGWSLGGIIALKYYEKYPKNVTKLFLISSTPCFINKKNWNLGVDESLLNKFYDQLLESWSKTLNQFFMLQLIGSNNKRVIMRGLHATFITKTPPKIKSLKSALEILKKTDLRKTICNIKVPTIIISGDCDRLTPKEASLFMQSKIKNSRLKVFKNAGHIPFLSHPKDFIKEVILSFNHKK